MSEWTSVLAVFWALWAIDGVRHLPRAVFTWIGGVRRAGARGQFGRWSWPGLLPASWRATVADVPLTLSPEGLCNRPAGTSGRPADVPSTIRAWRWEEVREVGIAQGWVFVNGQSFCPDTGHVHGRDFLALAQMPPAAREKRIRGLMRSWFRPAQLRRRVVSLRARTAPVATLNAVSLVLGVALTLYVVGNFAEDLPARWADAIARLLPSLAIGLLVTHVAAIGFAWRAKRRLKSFGPDRRGAALFSAFLLPPQAMRLRTIAGENFSPPQHPLAAALAWGSRAEQEAQAFRTLADLRWPIGGTDDPALARDVAGWYRRALEEVVIAQISRVGIATEPLFATPAPDGVESCSYCPRCRDQFGAGRATCPHGVELRPLR